jgi:hypothetical protein
VGMAAGSSQRPSRMPNETVWHERCCSQKIPLRAGHTRLWGSAKSVNTESRFIRPERACGFRKVAQGLLNSSLCELRVNQWVTLAFIGSGIVAAFAGIILQAQMQVGQSTVGQELMLPAFTGALLGAMAVRPGRPNVWGTILAVAVLAIAVAGLSQLGAPFFVEPLFNGGMLIIAVGLAVSTQGRREREAARREMERRTQGAPSPVRS